MSHKKELWVSAGHLVACVLFFHFDLIWLNQIYQFCNIRKLLVIISSSYMT